MTDVVFEPAPKGRKRDHIVETAARVFGERGYGVSVDEIAQAACVSKQTIYNQFGSKERLFRAVVERRVALLTADLDADGHRTPPREALTRWAVAYYETILTPRALALLRSLVTASGDAPEVAADFYALGPARTRDALARWIASERDLGRLDAADPALAAEHFHAMLFGHVQMKGLFGLPAELSAAEIRRRAAYCVGCFLKAHAPA